LSKCEYCGVTIKDKNDDGLCDHCGGPIPESEEEFKEEFKEEFEDDVSYLISDEDRLAEKDHAISKTFKILLTTVPLIIILFTMPLITPSILDNPLIPSHVNVIGFTKHADTNADVSAIIHIYFDGVLHEAFNANGQFHLGDMYLVGTVITIHGDCLENGRWLPTEVECVIPYGEPGDTVSIGVIWFYPNTTVIYG
jgi:hypothetical protein